MPKAKVTFELVRKLGLALPDVEEGAAYGSPALRARGKLLACIPANKSAEPGSLAVRIDFEQRAGLLAEAPETYYLTDHYRDYPAVLVRLSRIREDELRDLLQASWRFVSARKSAGSASRPPRTSSRRAAGRGAVRGSNSPAR
jgi:hypothetical protein